MTQSIEGGQGRSKLLGTILHISALPGHSETARQVLFPGPSVPDKPGWGEVLVCAHQNPFLCIQLSNTSQRPRLTVKHGALSSFQGLRPLALLGACWETLVTSLHISCPAAFSCIKRRSPLRGAWRSANKKSAIEVEDYSFSFGNSAFLLKAFLHLWHAARSLLQEKVRGLSSL